MQNLQSLIVKGGTIYRVDQTARMIENFNYYPARKIKELVFETTYSTMQSLCEILMAVHQVSVIPDRCEVFKVRALGGLILDIDIGGDLNRDRLNQVIKRQQNSFFSAG